MSLDHDIEQSEAAINEALPSICRMLKQLLVQSMKEGFTRKEAFELVKMHFQILAGGK